eukprot:5080499-Amphidinium_carterae.1
MSAPLKLFRCRSVRSASLTSPSAFALSFVSPASGSSLWTTNDMPRSVKRLSDGLTSWSSSIPAGSDGVSGGLRRHWGSRSSSLRAFCRSDAVSLSHGLSSLRSAGATA